MRAANSLVRLNLKRYERPLEASQGRSTTHLTRTDLEGSGPSSLFGDSLCAVSGQRQAGPGLESDAAAFDEGAWQH